jgi:hypothetical protein
MRLRHLLVPALAVLLGGVVMAAPGCTVFNGLVADTDGGTLGDAPITPVSDVAVDAPPGTAVCGQLPPSRKVAEDGPSSEFIVAVNKFLLKPAAGAKPIGFNLDGLCGCAESCKPPAGGSTICDDATGVDNTGLNVFNLQLAGIDLEQRANENLQKGDNGVLIRVSGYNGTPNDSTVQIEIFASQGTENPDGGSTGVKPKGTSADRWTIDQANVELPQLKSKERTDGYVRDGVLVAPNLSTNILIDADISVSFRYGVLTATIESLGNNEYALRDGVVAGRWPIIDALLTLSRISDPSSADKRTPFCETKSAFYTVGLQSLCAQTDVRADNDNAGELPCDAVSTAMGFEALPGSLGKLVDTVPTKRCDGVAPPSCVK